MADLSGTRSLAQAQEAIRAYARANGNRPWIIGGGWNQEAWGLGRFPTAAELDAAVGDKPVLLERADGHAVWANSAAIKAAGITAQTKYRVPSQPSMDGNTVELASEQTAFAENAVQYQTTLSFLNGRIGQITRALKGE